MQDKHIDDDEMVSLKRNAIMDLIGAILDTPRKEQSAELWKVLIDGALDRLDTQVYEPIIQSEQLAILKRLKEQEVIYHYQRYIGEGYFKAVPVEAIQAEIDRIGGK